MAFSDQVKKLEGKNVCVQTVRGNIFGRLVEVKSTTLILREHDNNRRTIVRDSKIISVTEHDPHC